MDAIARTTEIEAINEMLNAIGEGAVSSIDTGNSDVVQASELLRRHSRRLQSNGWWFNTNYSLRLSPDTNGYINLPSNCLKVDATDDDRYEPIVMRGERLFNLKTNSYVFDKALSVDMVVGLEWEELPQIVRDYIVASAGLEFVDTEIGSEVRHAFTEKRRNEAFIVMRSTETENGDYNMMRDSFSGMELVDRRL